MTVSEKAAYIKGLIEGMSIDTTKGEGKVLAAMADLLEDLSLTVLDIEDEAATLRDYIEEIDEDLGAVEEDFYCIDEDECECGCGCGPDCDCGCQEGLECTCGGDCDCGCGCDCDDDDDCDCDCCECYELECPACNNPVYIDEDDIDEIEELECPSCGKVLSVVELPEEDEESTDEE